MQIGTVADAEAFSFDQVDNPDVVVWDLHESAEQDRGAIFAALKSKLVERPAGPSKSRSLRVDEAVR